MEEIDDEILDEMVQNALDETVKTDRDRNRTYKPLEETPKAQILVNQQLIVEMRNLESSLESYKRQSKWMTRAMIFLSTTLVLLGILQILTMHGVIGN
jgi:hypothetical protein